MAASDEVLEWLETDGDGGFACGSVDGEVRRFWHGLLWLARKPPTDRVRLVAGMEEHLAKAGGELALSRVLTPQGWSGPDIAAHFLPHSDSMWLWELPGGGTLTRRVTCARHGAATVIAYELQGASEVTLRLVPILGHDPGSGTWHDDGSLGVVGNLPVVVSASTAVTAAGGAAQGPLRTLHAIEAECEDEPRADLWRGPDFLLPVRAGAVSYLVISTDTVEAGEFGAKAFAEQEHRRAQLDIKALERLSGLSAGLRQALARAADAFIVRRIDGRHTIMAGYPWFTDWGRDTMIALPGLCLSTGRYTDARSILAHFLTHADEGLIPNLFPEAGSAPEFNTVDATLWLFEAAFRYARESGDTAFLQENAQRLASILEWHERGTRNDIRVDTDGLLRAGSPGTQLTWMDVKVNGHVPTPRHGKPVEVQGLWYNALRLMVERGTDLGLDSTRVQEWAALADRARGSFAKRFAEAGTEHLADVIDRDGAGTADWSIRPNMAIPFSLSHNIVPEWKRADVLRATARFLVTPRGLRSLAPGEREYHGVYRGGRVARDHAYHQGTVWMWPLWPWVKGVADNVRAVPELASTLPSLAGELLRHFQHEGCVHSASEIFDADTPHRARGCFAQAWSVSAIIEILRLAGSVRGGAA